MALNKQSLLVILACPFTLRISQGREKRCKQWKAKKDLRAAVSQPAMNPTWKPLETNGGGITELLKRLALDEQIKSGPSTVEYYSAIKKNNEVLTHAITWWTLKALCPVKEVRHKRLCHTSYGISRIGKSIEKEVD